MSDLSSEVQRLLSVVQHQQASIEKLTEAVERLQAALPVPAVEEPAAPQEPEPAAEPPAPALTVRHPLDWDVVTGAERALAWQELFAWVEHIVKAYSLHFLIRPCWWRHRLSLMILTSLWEYYMDTYANGGGIRSNDEFLNQLNNRTYQLGDVFISCREDHTEPAPAVWLRDDDRREFMDMVRAEFYSTPVSGQTVN